MFNAKKIKENSYALFEDGNEFARLQFVRGKYLLSTANAELKRLFDATVFAADATIKSVLWAIRAMLDHLAALARDAALVVEGRAEAVVFLEREGLLCSA